MLPESVSEATLLAWHKEVGEPFRRDDLLIEIETEKIVLEVTAPSDGVLIEIVKPAAETIYEGDVLGVWSSSAAAEAKTAEPVQTVMQPVEKPVSAPVEAEPEPVPEEQADSDAQLSPAARRVASESGIDVSEIAGTGKDGRITKADVVQAVEEADAGAEESEPEVEAEPPASAAQADSAPAASVRQAEPQPVAEADGRSVKRQPMSRLRRTIADRLVHAQHTAALLTTFNEVDMSEVMAVRKKYRDDFEKKHGARLGFMSFFVKAAVESLKAIPAVNAMIDGSEIVYHSYCDVGIAVSSPRGLVVPILRDAQSMGFAEIEKSIRDFGQRAKDGTLTLDELTGGTFTITNGGVFGSLVSTPIVNPPQSAILGMHKIQERPVVENGQVVVKPMMYLALTYDHRIIDGREAVTFLVGIKDGLEDPTRLLLEV